MEAVQINTSVSRSLTVSEKLARLRNTYAETLPQKIDEVETIANPLHTNPSLEVVNQSLMELRSSTHKLAGSGATFGFAAVGDVARELEQISDGVLHSTSGLSAELTSKILALVIDLRAAFERGMDAPEGAIVETTVTDEKRRRFLDVGEARPIVLVEDNEVLANQLKTELENFGFGVTLLLDPSGLRKELDRSDAAAVIMDVVFEGDDQVATDTVQQLRTEGLLPQPVIFLSGRIDAKARLAAVRAGCDAYLTKPVTVTGLVDTLDRFTSDHDVDPARVLIIDDDNSMACYHATVLKDAGMITKVVTDPLMAIEAIESFSPELILLDLYMHACNGSELAMVIRQDQKLAGLPIVFLSNELELDSQLDAMRRGGDDFLIKSIQPEQLIKAISLRTARFRALRALMVRDSLTGLLDHSATKQALETEIARAHRSGEPLTFALIDLDHFKSVNDQYGHQAGDWVIKSLARLLKQRLRGFDIIGRMGGEEFAVVLSGADLQAAGRVLDQIRIAFSEIKHQSEDDEFQVTFSCGLAAYTDYETASALTNAADKALYEAKSQGRDRVVLSGPACAQRGPELHRCGI
jgi:diguanylate cyclase (GGDEF)-like protein